MRFNLAIASGAVVLVLAGCAKDSGVAKADSAAADSIRDAHDASTTVSVPSVPTGSPTDSVKAAVNSTEGTIGETRKRVRTREPDTMGRDSVIHGPYKTMDSLGQIKR